MGKGLPCLIEQQSIKGIGCCIARCIGSNSRLHKAAVLPPDRLATWVGRGRNNPTCTDEALALYVGDSILKNIGNLFD